MKDQFSKQSTGYAKYRPVYPDELFDFILSRLSGRDQAWDCGTGNGQTALVLSNYFEKVFATDISQQQLANAPAASNVIYSVQAAESTGFAANSFDLVTVSQALHWFKFDEFYEEVKRVGRKDSWIAAWMYALPQISPAIDDLVRRHHFETLGKYWEPERKYVDEHYVHIPFPFFEIQTPSFAISIQWTSDDLIGYLNTWSALQKFISLNSFNPVDLLKHQLTHHWKGQKMKAIFPVRLRMGQVKK